MSTLKALCLAAVFAAATAAATPTLAQSMQMDVGAWPKVGFETAVNFEYDHYAQHGSASSGAFNVQAEHQTLIEFDNHWSVSNLLTLEPGQDPTPGKEQFLSDHELYAEELFGRWNNELVNVRFGKFAQNFARGWYLTPGLYGQDFAGDYGLAETVGADAQFDLGFPSAGLHQVSISTFMVDRSFLSQSLIYNRGQVHYQDGGPANTKGLDSFVMSYDATNVPVGPHAALNYQLSAATLGGGLGADGAERRYSAGADVNVPLFGGTIGQTLHGRFNELRVFGEVVHYDRADGVNGRHRNYATGAVELVNGPWVLDLAATDRWMKDVMSPTVHDTMRTISIGYSLPSDTSVALGVSRETVDGDKGVIVGLSISQTFTLCDRCLIRGRHY